MYIAANPGAVCQGLFNQIHNLFKKSPTRTRSSCASGYSGRSLAFHHLTYLAFEHTLDFVLHCLGAGFAEVRPHPVSDIVNLLDQRGRRFWDGGSGDCLAGIVGHRFSFQIHQNGCFKGAFCAFDWVTLQNQRDRQSSTYVENGSLALIRPPARAEDRGGNGYALGSVMEWYQKE